MEGMEVMEESIRTIAEKLKEFHVGTVFSVTGKKKPLYCISKTVRLRSAVEL